MTSCDHKWKPIFTMSKDGTFSDGFYMCGSCKTVGSKDPYSGGTNILIERCAQQACIAPAKHLHGEDQIPLCARCHYNLYSVPGYETSFKK